jgi:hypothetical protein
MEEARKILQTIATAKLQKKDAKTLGLMMEKTLLREKLTSDAESKLNRFLKTNGLFEKLQFIYELYETNLERDFAETIIKNELLPPNVYPMYKRFNGLIKNEIKLARIDKKEKVLFIGSGPFPISAILLNKLTSCAVDCYETKKKHADIARKVISCLRLEDRIRIIRRKGEYLSNDKYSVIIIALLAKPKKEIIERISRKLPGNIRVICRTSHGIRRAFYEPADLRISGSLQIIATKRATGNQTISSLLMQKSSNS